MMSSGVIDSLLISLGYDYDSSGGDKFSSDMDDLQKKAAAFVAAVAGGAAAVYGLAAATSAGIDKQGKLADSVDESIETVDALAHSLSLVGEESQSVGQILIGLSSMISEASRGLGSGVEVFGRLGISVRDSTGELKGSLDMLLDIADAMEGLDRSEQIELVRRLGLEPAIKLLQQGSDGIKALIEDARALGVATKEDAAISADFQDSISRTTKVVKYLGVLLNREVTPYLTTATNKVIDWWKANKELVEQNIGEYVKKFADNIKYLTTIAIAFIAVGFATKLLGILAAMRKVAVGAMIMSAAVFAIPIAIGAIVAAIALLATEADRFFDGRSNIYSDWLEDYPEFKSSIETTTAVFGTISDLVGRIYSGWKNIFDLFKSDTSFEEHLENLKNMALDSIGLGPLNDPLGEKGFVDNDVFKFFSGLIPSFNFGQTKGGESIPTPTVPMSGKIIRNEYKIEVGGIRIDGSKSPSDTAEAVSRVLLQERAALVTNQEG